MNIVSSAAVTIATRLPRVCHTTATRLQGDGCVVSEPMVVVLDPGRAISCVNYQWQSCGNCVAIAWQLCGKRVAVATAAKGLSPTSGPGFCQGTKAYGQQRLGPREP